MSDEQKQSASLQNRAQHLLAGLEVSSVRLADKMVLVEFTNGTRLFVDSATNVEVSITGGDR